MELSALNESQVSRRSILGGFLAAGATVLMSGCTFGGSSKSNKHDAKGGLLTVALALAVDSLDPHYVNNGSYVSPCGLLEGLVAVDASAKAAVPAIAEKWDVSGDGMTYTFHLRSTAKFSNGDPISAHDFEWTYKRLLTPTGAGGGGTVGANSYQPSLGIKGANDYLAGTLTDWSQVGIHAVDDKTLVMTLASPNSTFLLGLTNVSMLLLHPPSVQKYPKDWMQPAHWVGSGPYVLTAWVPTSSLSMTAHDHYWDRANVHIAKVNARIIQDSTAMLLAYRNNEVDVEANDVANYPSDTTLKSQTESADGYAVSFFQTMFSRHPASRDARVRRALSMAINRDEIAKVVVGSQPGVSLVPSSVPGWNRSLATSHDADHAKALLAQAGYPGGKGMPTIQLLDYKDRPESNAVADMWQSTLGLTVKRNIVDLGLVATIRYKPISDPNEWGFSTSGFGGLPTMPQWVVNFWGPSVIPFFSLPADQAGKYNEVQADAKLSGAQKAKQLAAITDRYATPEAKKFAADATAAASIVEPAKQLAAFLDAAQQREALCYEIPLYWQATSFLVKPEVKNFHVLYTPNGFYYKGITITK